MLVDHGARCAGEGEARDGSDADALGCPWRRRVWGWGWGVGKWRGKGGGAVQLGGGSVIYARGYDGGVSCSEVVLVGPSGGLTKWGQRTGVGLLAEDVGREHLVPRLGGRWVGVGWGAVRCGGDVMQL